MKTLILMRHGKSSHDVSKVTDHERPLKTRGILASIAMGKLMREEGLQPGLILSSTAQRAKHTAELACKHAEFKQPIAFLGELYHAEPETYLRMVRQYAKDEKSVILFGHNPGMEDLVTLLTGKHEAFPTAAVAKIDLNIDSWSDLNPKAKGTLAGFWRPRDSDAD